MYRKYYSGVLLYCISLCGSRELAEDLTAEAFVKAYLSLPHEIPSFQYWLFRVCRNLWIDHARRHRRFVSAETLTHLSDLNTPEALYLLSERRQALWNAISSLPPPDRELVVLHYFSGLPLTEIARLLGKSHAAVRQRMVRLRATLKQRMEEQDHGRN